MKGGGQHLVVRRHDGLGVLGADAFIHHLERQLGGLADDIHQPLRIALAGRLDRDAVRALLADVGLLGAHEVDPAADDLDRLGDGVARLLLHRLRRERDLELIAAARDQHLAAGAREGPAHLGQRGLRLIHQ